MSSPAPEAPDFQPVHETLVGEFTERYLRDTGFGKFAYALPYDPTDTLCDYGRTTWPVKPNAVVGIPVARFVLGMTHHLKYGQVKELEATVFAGKAGELSEGLQDYPVLLMSGHKPDMQAALNLVLSELAIARRDADQGRGSFRGNFKRMAEISHAVGTRAFSPVIIGKRPVRIASLVRVSQMVMNPHLSFPATDRMQESGLPRDFRSQYNDIFDEEFMAPFIAEPTHPYGYHDLAATPPSGAPDAKGLDVEGREISVTRRVSPGTIRFILKAGFGLVPVYAEFGRGKAPTHMELGGIIPPNEVTEAVIQGIMFDQAEFRRDKAPAGSRPVYYEHDPRVGTILRGDVRSEEASGS